MQGWTRRIARDAFDAGFAVNKLRVCLSPPGSSELNWSLASWASLEALLRLC